MVDDDSSDIVKEFSNVLEGNRENIVVFSNSFKKSLKEYKKDNRQPVMWEKICWHLNRIREDTPKREQSEHLGAVLGITIAIVEYWIPTTSDSNIMFNETRILADFGGLSRELKDMGKKVKFTFIERRIKKIEKRYTSYTKKIDDDRKKLILKIAAKFI